MDNQQVPKADSKFQKIARKNHRKWKLRLLSKGGQKAESGGGPYKEKPDYNRAKSAPPGFGGLEEHIVKKGSKYCLMSKKTNKNLGCYSSRKGAMKREKQVQYFKHLKETIVTEELEKALIEEGISDMIKGAGSWALEKLNSLFTSKEKEKDEKENSSENNDKSSDLDAKKDSSKKTTQNIIRQALIYGHSQAGGIGLTLKKALESKGYKVNLVIKNGANDSRLLSEIGDAGDLSKYDKVFLFAGGNYPKVPRVPEISAIIQKFDPQKTILILPPINIDEEVAKNIASRNEKNREGINQKFGGIVKVYIPAGTTKDFNKDGVHMLAGSEASINFSNKVISDMNSVSAKPRNFLDDLKNSITSNNLYKAVVDFSRNKLSKYVEDTGDEYPQKNNQGRYSKIEYYKDKEFSDEVNRVAKKFDIDPLDLLAVMHIESGLNPSAKAPGSNAAGLIQFIPGTIKAMNRRFGLSLTSEEIRSMSRAQQMDLVEKFFDMNNLRKGASGAEIYATVFLPARRYRDVLTTSDEGYYKSNKGLDRDKDGDIDQGDIEGFVNRHRNMVKPSLSESKKITIRFGEVLQEEKKKDDRCVRIAKRKYKAWPSAYASGAVVKCRQGKIWKSVKEEGQELEEEWSKSERDKRKSKCSDPKGFTMKQFCKNQRTRSKQGEKTNERLNKTDPGHTFKGQSHFYSNDQEEEMDEGRKLGKPSSETNLGDWFKRKGAPGKKGGWVDCNTCRDGKCKPCGRQDGEKRSKYPRCRPTASQCKGYKRRHSNLQREEDE